MQKIVVVGRVSERLNKVKEELQSYIETQHNAKLVTVRPGYVETVMEPSVQCLIVDVEFINKNIFPTVVQVRKTGYSGPILVLGNPAQGFDLKEFQGVQGLYHLQKPYQESQLVGLIKNCINIEYLRKRRDQRFSVCEQATLESYNSDVRMQTTISDISRSGVRIEGALGELRQGDLLKLHFNFDKIQKERVMNARIVWIKRSAESKEEAGLEFISQKAVYKYLLDVAVA